MKVGVGGQHAGIADGLIDAQALHVARLRAHLVHDRDDFDRDGHDASNKTMVTTMTDAGVGAETHQALRLSCWASWHLSWKARQTRQTDL